MNIIKTSIEGPLILEPRIFRDDRGYFFESFSQRTFNEEVREIHFVQDNESKSSYGVVRGLHFQINYPQCKLVRAVRGSVFDVAVDLREGSATYGKWYGVELSEENKKQFLIPEGFAHGFLVLSDTAEFVYKCTNFYDPQDDSGIIWNDKDIGIDWPLEENVQVLLSEKDKKQQTFKNYVEKMKSI